MKEGRLRQSPLSKFEVESRASPPNLRHSNRFVANRLMQDRPKLLGRFKALGLADALVFGLARFPFFLPF